MRNIATVLLVLAAIIGMAGPVLGAESGSSATAYADWFYANAQTGAYAQTGFADPSPDAYADAGTFGEAAGSATNGAGATASDVTNDASAGTGGNAVGGDAYTVSNGYAESNNVGGVTDAGADSYAIGTTVITNSGASSFWGPPIWSGAGAEAYSSDFYAESGASSSADAP